MLLTKNGSGGSALTPGNSRVNDRSRIHRTIIYGDINTLNLQIEFTIPEYLLATLACTKSHKHGRQPRRPPSVGAASWHVHWCRKSCEDQGCAAIHSCMSFCLRLFSSLKGSDSNGQDEWSLVWGWVRTTLVAHQLHWISLMTQVENTYAWARARLEIVVSKMADVVFKKKN